MKKSKHFNISQLGDKQNIRKYFVRTVFCCGGKGDQIRVKFTTRFYNIMYNLIYIYLNIYNKKKTNE